MDDAVLARRSAREALSDIEPEPLRQTLDERLATASMTPGALTLLSARAFCHDVDVAAFDEQAAGVQLIYEGLTLTRRLAHDEPWAHTDEDDIDADIDVVAADVLVSRGFYLLARTAAAERAVEVVRAFGRDQTTREDHTDPDRDRNLEADVFELAVVTGVDAVDGTTSDALLAYAEDLARGYEGALPVAGDLLGAGTHDRLATFSDGPVGSPPRSAGTDP
ncbi:hypothetical protein Halar_2712 [halophilic archaeon DL31]|nr:hypothetical protein Halar_2712 [halophilic archaeon DL31]